MCTSHLSPIFTRQNLGILDACFVTSSLSCLLLDRAFFYPFVMEFIPHWLLHCFLLRLCSHRISDSLALLLGSLSGSFNMMLLRVGDRFPLVFHVGGLYFLYHYSAFRYLLISDSVSGSFTILPQIVSLS